MQAPQPSWPRTVLPTKVAAAYIAVGGDTYIVVEDTYIVGRVYSSRGDTYIVVEDTYIVGRVYSSRGDTYSSRGHI
jgi:hypothetical protein